MPGVKWTEDEIRILDQYERTAKSAFVLYQEIRIAGYNRTYKAVSRKIESLGLRKPTRYTTGHEMTIGYLDIESKDLVLISMLCCLGVLKEEVTRKLLELKLQEKS